MRFYRAIILVLSTSYFGQGSCYTGVYKRHQTCGRFRPCRATTDTRPMLFDETEGSSNESMTTRTDMQQDLDESFRLEMDRRLQNLETTDTNNIDNLNIQTLELQLQKQKEDRAQLEDKLIRTMDEKLRKQATEKDDEINRLVALKEQRETEINRLKFQLNESKAAIEERVVQVRDAENRLRSLKQEYTTKIEADKVLFDQYSNERESLRERIKSMDEVLVDTTNKSQREMDEIKTQLENQISKSKKLAEDMQQEQKDKIKLKQDYETEMSQLKVESQKRQMAINTVAGYEKKELRKISWDLESKLEAAKYELIIARREYQSWKDKATILENQLKDLQLSTEETITELQERLEADRMFYAKSKLSTKNRMEKIVQMFLRRMNRREIKADRVLQDSIAEWSQRLETTTQLFEEEKRSISLAKDDEIARKDFESQSKISALQLEMDETILELNKRMAEIKADGKSSLNSLRTKHKNDMTDFASKTELEKKALIREMEEEQNRAIQALELNLSRQFEQQLGRSMDALSVQFYKEKYDLSLELTQQIIKERSRRMNLEDEMQGVQGKIIQYEKERSSLKSLLLLSWRLSKQRCLKLIRRR